jgi:putative intracellular protease/amidase
VGREVYERGGVVGAVCHGPIALVNITLSDGSYLVAGKDVAGKQKSSSLG